MTQVQAAYLGSGNAGGGVLKYKGGTYAFNVGGLGVGGIGVSKIEASGEIYEPVTSSTGTLTIVTARHGSILSPRLLLAVPGSYRLTAACEYQFALSSRPTRQANWRPFFP